MRTINTAKILVACSKPTLWGGLVGLLLLFSSCTTIDLEDPLKGKITLNTDWSNRTAGVEIPASYTVMIANQTLEFTKQSNILPELSAGTYPILIHNTADKINISKTTATVAATNGIVEPMPGWLFAATAKAQYADFKEETITAVMQQQVRQLTIELTVKEGDPERIQSLTGKLSGVANMLDFESNVHTGTNLSTAPLFTRNGNKLTAIVRLLGIAGGEQKLTLNITFTDGKTQSIESSLSTLLSEFNTNKHVPVSVSADLNTPIEVGFTATITGWKSVPNSGGVAN